MSNPPTSVTPLSHLRRLCDPAEQEKLQTDAELLAMYVSSGDQRAMETLIRRYSGLVASVCRLTVSDPASAEDAFQATFLILIKSAQKIQSQSSVAAWLHGVAYRTACRLRTQGRKQFSNQSSVDVNAASEPLGDPVVELARRMELEVLDRELENLPARLKEPLIEHYLLGYTAPEIAERMELSVAAVEGRLRRGRRTLRTLLARRGISLSVVLAGAAWFEKHLQAAEASAWTSRLLDNCLPAGEGPELVSSDPNVSSLVQGELTMLSTGTLKVALSASAMLIVGTFIAFSVSVADDNRAGSSGSPKGGMIVHSEAMPQLGSTVIAQFAGSGTELSNEANEEAAEETTSQTGGLAEGTGFGNAEVSEPVEWQKPESAEGGAPPDWLAGGASSLSALEKTRRLLAEHVNCEFNRVPLLEVVQELSADTIITLNSAELEELGIAVDTPITVATTNASSSLREVLRRICEPLDLSYVVTESTIEITTREDAEDRPSMRFYDLSYVLPNSANTRSLMDAIETTIEPTSWSSQGGENGISLVGSMMVVSAPDTTHQNIEVFLMNISRMNPKNAAKPTPPAIYGGYGMGSMGGMGGMGGGMGGMGGGMF